MDLGKIENVNYCGTVVKLETFAEMSNCDNLKYAMIFGNKVIVEKSTEAGKIGVFFPVGTQLSNDLLRMNNMYSKAEMNNDPEKKGYFGKNGLVRCVKLRGNESEGIFIPIEDMKWFLKPGDELEIGMSFDKINGHDVCRKYVPNTNTRREGLRESKLNKRTKKVSKLVDGQFRFHIDTQMFYRNLDKITRDDLISVTYKIHGTSGISAYILCKKLWKNMTFKEKLRNFFLHEEILDYDYIYSSRKVIKNAYETSNAQGFYGSEDIWKTATEELKPFLQKGMTFYYEIAGFLENGTAIQKNYTYGCLPKEHKIYIYRITYTNVDGKVFEFSMKQVQDFCRIYGLNAVPLLFYGTAKDYVNSHYKEFNFDACSDMTELEFEENFLEYLKKDYNEKDCYICNNGFPEEGCVVRKEINGIESYKVKSTRFYELETKELEAGETNIEDEN